MPSNDDPSYLNYYRAIEPAVSHHHVGHCGEYAGLVLNLLLEKGLTGDRIRLLEGSLGERNDHICVVVDCEDDTEPDQPGTYGRGAAVCDAWIDLVSSPHGFFRAMELIKFNFKPNELAGIHDRL